MHKNFTPYMSNSTKNDLHKCKILLKEAICSKNAMKWTEFKFFRNALDKKIKSEKKTYFETKFKHFKDKWSFIKFNSMVKKNHTPQL